MAKSNGQDLDLSNFMGEWGVDFFMAREHDPRERQRERGGMLPIFPNISTQMCSTYY